LDNTNERTEYTEVDHSTVPGSTVPETAATDATLQPIEPEYQAVEAELQEKSSPYQFNTG